MPPRKPKRLSNSANLFIPTPAERTEFEENLRHCHAAKKSEHCSSSRQNNNLCHSTELQNHSELQLRLCPHCEQLWTEDKKSDVSTAPRTVFDRHWQAFTNTVDSIKQAIINKLADTSPMRYGLKKMLFPHVTRNICGEPACRRGTAATSDVLCRHSSGASNYYGNYDYPTGIPCSFLSSNDKYWQSDWMTITIRKEPHNKRQDLKRKAEGDQMNEGPAVKRSKDAHTSNKRTRDIWNS